MTTGRKRNVRDYAYPPDNASPREPVTVDPLAQAVSRQAKPDDPVA